MADSDAAGPRLLFSSRSSQNTSSGHFPPTQPFVSRSPASPRRPIHRGAQGQDSPPGSCGSALLLLLACRPWEPSLLHRSLSLTAARLSPRREMQPLHLSIKRLISPLLVPACLSVCLTCRQLSRRSGVAVSQVLVSLLLSVHLPVRHSQIRHVNLPPGFPVLGESFIKSQQAGNVLFSPQAKLIMAP